MYITTGKIYTKFKFQTLSILQFRWHKKHLLCLFLGGFFCIVLESLKVIQGHDLPDLTRHDPFNNVTLYLVSIPPFPSNKKKMEEDLYNLEDFLCGLQITSLVYVAQPSDRSKLRYLCTISHYNAPTVLSLQLIKPHQTINVICRLIIYQH